MWPPVSALHSGQMIVVERDVACLDGVAVGAQEFGQGGSPARLALRSYRALSIAARAWVATPERPTEAPAQRSLV